MKVIYTVCAEGSAALSPAEQYRSNDTGEDNANAQLEPQIMGREVVGCHHHRRAGLSSVGADILWRVWIDYPPDKEDENQ